MAATPRRKRHGVGARQQVARRFAVAAASLLVAAIVAIAGRPATGLVPVPGLVLTSATDFALSGSVAELTPGVTSSLQLTATNPYAVDIAIGSVTVSIAAVSVPSSCALGNLHVGGQAFPPSPSGSPARFAVTVAAPSAPLPVTVSHNASAPIALPILLTRSAGNGCQRVTFPFTYSATGAYTATTTTALASAPNPSAFAQPVVFTATVTPSVTPDPGAPVPAGTVTLYRCTDATCTSRVTLGAAIALDGNGKATFTTSSLAVGPHNLQAVFTPNDPTNFAPSTSPQHTHVVTKAATALTLSTAPNPSLFGQSIDVAAQTSPSAGPSGVVRFYACTSSSCATRSLLSSTMLDSNGRASYATSALPPGTNWLTATYAGDASYLGSTSNVATHTVTFSSPCITTTLKNGYTVTAGKSVCIAGPGEVKKGITVQAGGALFVNGATVSGGITSNGAKALRICAASVTGGLTVNSSTGFVVIGDFGDDGPPGCAGNAITGGVTLTANQAGFEVAGNQISGGASFSANTGAGPTAEDASPEVEGNTISGSLACTTSNNPAISNGGQPNSVTGSRSGQCAGVGF